VKDIHTINVEFAAYVSLRMLLTETFCASEAGKDLERRLVEFCLIDSNVAPEKLTAFLQTEVDRIDPIHRLGSGAAAPS
jgi:hypothetical protein